MTDEPAVYLHVKIQLVRGKYTLFAKTMAEMAPVLEDNGWHLVVALSPGHRPAQRRVPRVAGAVAEQRAQRSGRRARASRRPALA